MKSFFLSFISILVIIISYGQTGMIKQVFKLLPADKVYHLSLAARDSILDGKTYYPAENTSDEIVAYNYGISVNVNDYIYISMSFETGQRGTGIVEIRSFKMLSGDNMILVSQTGGVWEANYSQQEFSTFVYSKNKKLTPYKGKVLPAIDEHLFIKQGIPDTLKKEIQNNSNLCFDLSNEKIMMSLNSRYISGDTELRKWLKGDIAYFEWIKDKFIIHKIEFAD